jgi:K+-sensing histidine kinase KdpD
MSEPRPRRQRTPEEIAKSMEIAKSVMKDQKKQDGLNHVKQGRNYIYLVAVVMAITGGIDYFMSEVVEVFYFYVPVILIFVLLGIYYFRNPLVISYVALSLFILMHVFFAVLDPTNIAKGLIIKFIVIAALVNAIRNAKKYKDELERENKPKATDVLDDELIDFK